MAYQPAPQMQQAPSQNSAIFLIVAGFLCGGTIPAIFGIIALVQMNSDPASARTMLKIGWILFWVLFGLTLLFVVGYLLIMGVGILLTLMSAGAVSG